LNKVVSKTIVIINNKKHIYIDLKKQLNFRNKDIYSNNNRINGS